MSATLAHLQEYRKQSDLQKVVCKYGLKINPSRTKIMRINYMKKENVTLSRRATDKIETLFYLRFVETKEVGTQQDTKNYISNTFLPVNYFQYIKLSCYPYNPSHIYLKQT